uniref:Recep_L_domain domain-containing protein n=1 Tax=Caenorhabditis tropicalis TaxID=1561998 RepID=A0A1I7T627_9PELO
MNFHTCSPFFQSFPIHFINFNGEKLLLFKRYSMLGKLFPILFLAPLCFGKPFRVCKGDQLSATDVSEVDELYALVNQTRCTHVIGDIVINNLTDVTLPVEIYERIRKVFGSIIVMNNTRINSPIHFESLQIINATLLPAITVIHNNDVFVSVGRLFKKAMSNYRNRFKYAVLLNKNFILDTEQYNFWYLAGYPKAKFLTDSSFRVSVCDENLFKPVAGILGFLFVALIVAFSTVAFYDRKGIF